MRSRTVALVVALAVVAGACGDDERPFRIGVVVDCVGIGRPLRDAELSGAALPLIERGARLRGARASDGVTAPTVAGRRVELVRGCTEVFEFSVLARELRRLAENERVDAVVAAGAGPDELILRDIARDHDGVVFLPVAHGPREVTLRRPAANVFRVAGDYGQGVAGLGAHAYHALGWRRAAVVLGNWDAGWLSRDAFVTEFCALGGTVSEQLALDSFDRSGGDVARVPRDVDGVAVFAGTLYGPGGFIKRLARRARDPARELLVGPGIVDDPGLLRETAGALAGVAGSSNADPRRMRDYVRRYARAFPGASEELARSEAVTGYRDAVEALLQGLERAGGDAGRLRAALATQRVELLGGPVRLDGNRQAIVSTSVVRIQAGPDGPTLEPVAREDGVDQSIGGRLAPSRSPDNRPAACRHKRSR